VASTEQTTRGADVAAARGGAARRSVRRHRPVGLQAVPTFEAPPAEPAQTGKAGASRWLRGVLFGLDALAIVIGWSLTVLVLGGTEGNGLSRLAGLGTVLVVTLVAIGWQGLYLARVCSVRAVETARLGRAAAISAVAALLLSPRVGDTVEAATAVAAGVVTFLLLVSFRALYNIWLHKMRSEGRFCRPVVVVGTGDEGFELYRLLELHPELGFRVEGVVGPELPFRDWDVRAPWLGEVDDAASLARASGANGALVAASDLSSEELNRVTRSLLAEGVHVHLSSGLRGIDHRRLRSLPLAHEPLFYLEPVSLSRWQFIVKRAIDLVLATVLTILTAPIWIVAAIAVKLQDGGPLLFKQQRVGHHGKDFTVFKLRTMVVDAEARKDELDAVNEREGGPLFKVAHDPRRTRVGRIIERASIDELPQPINVFRGEMSLVGPRPALREEVEQFDGELLNRQRVLPGITGLWQVEGRENPAFDVYRRLDLFYVENWSVSLDLAIMLGTVRSIVARLLWRRSGGEQTPDLRRTSVEADLAL
jgi:exopolysaccharide biosynthesis polyprenyl glycosylphosphotransferase